LFALKGQNYIQVIVKLKIISLTLWSFSASHQAPNYVQRSKISQNISNGLVAVAVQFRLFFQFTYVQYCTIATKRNNIAIPFFIIIPLYFLKIHYLKSN